MELGQNSEDTGSAQTQFWNFWTFLTNSSKTVKYYINNVYTEVNSVLYVLDQYGNILVIHEGGTEQMSGWSNFWGTRLYGKYSLKFRPGYWGNVLGSSYFDIQFYKIVLNFLIYFNFKTCVLGKVKDFGTCGQGFLLEM